MLGTDNIAVPSGTGGTGKYDKTTTTTNNAESKVTEKKSATPGSVVRQSVSVVVDTKATGVDLAKLQSAISTAAGIDTTRGDTLNVTSMAFDTSAAKTAAAELKKAEAAQQKAQMIGWAKQALIILGHRGAAVPHLDVAAQAALRRLGRGARAPRPDGAARGRARPAGAASRRSTAPSQLPALEAGGGAAPVTPQRRKDDVLALVERQPDEVAELLRGWLADRRS